VRHKFDFEPRSRTLLVISLTARLHALMRCSRQAGCVGDDLSAEQGFRAMAVD